MVDDYYFILCVQVMFPMRVTSAIKAKLKVEKNTSKRASTSNQTNPELERIQKECYEELFTECSRISEEQGMRLGSLLPLAVRILLSMSPRRIITNTPRNFRQK